MSRALLAPLGAAYAAAAGLRVAAYRRGLLAQARLEGPVISVGNLALGGSGKTPLVARLAEILRDAGHAVAVLSRGYRGRFHGEALVVGDGQRVLAEAEEAGDEPVMLARSLRGVVVAVGGRRDKVGRLVEERYGRRVHVLDDGFQHLRLARDLDVVCLTAEDLVDRPVPAGRLREGRGALKRADVLFLLDGAAEAASGLPREKTFRWTRRGLGFFDLEGRERPAPVRPFLLAAIARPERFAADVRARAGEPAGARFRRDHHRFDEEELAAVAALARASGADAIVVTAKDEVRLPASARALGTPISVFRIAAEIAEEERLRDRLLAVAGRAA